MLSEQTCESRAIELCDVIGTLGQQDLLIMRSLASGGKSSTQLEGVLHLKAQTIRKYHFSKLARLGIIETNSRSGARLTPSGEELLRRIDGRGEDRNPGGNEATPATVPSPVDKSSPAQNDLPAVDNVTKSANDPPAGDSKATSASITPSVDNKTKARKALESFSRVKPETYQQLKDYAGPAGRFSIRDLDRDIPGTPWILILQSLKNVGVLNLEPGPDGDRIYTFAEGY